MRLYGEKDITSKNGVEINIKLFTRDELNEKYTHSLKFTFGDSNCFILKGLEYGCGVMFFQGLDHCKINSDIIESIVNFLKRCTVDIHGAFDDQLKNYYGSKLKVSSFFHITNYAYSKKYEDLGFTKVHQYYNNNENRDQVMLGLFLKESVNSEEKKEALTL